MDLPTTLPAFEFTSYADDPRSPVDQRDWGLAVRRRQIASDITEDLSVQMIVDGDQEADLREFYNVTTQMGSIPFNAPIRIEGTVQTREVKFIGAPPAYTVFGPGLMRATCKLLTSP